MTRPQHPDDIAAALAEPFEAHEVKFRAGATAGNRALALPYVDARVIQDRLDDVLGVAGWQDEYDCMPDGSVVCKLRLRIGEDWITKMDVGGQSEQPDGGDRLKSAFSDALKRAAVKFGIGRYLYRLPQQWVDYDAKRKQLVKVPTLPAAALPKGPARAPAKAAEPAPEPAAAPPAPASNGHEEKPVVGKALLERLLRKERELVEAHLANPGELLAAVRGLIKERAPHLGKNIETWDEEGYKLAKAAVTVFERRARAAAAREGAPA